MITVFSVNTVLELCVAVSRADTVEIGIAVSCDVNILHDNESTLKNINRTLSQEGKIGYNPAMQNILVVVDMQNDFVTGALGSKAAEEIAAGIRDKVLSFEGKVIYTRDTHGGDYMTTEEGRNLPVPHCIKGTWGWEIVDALRDIRESMVIDKPAFGSTVLGEVLRGLDRKEKIASVTLLGLCTDICVISNAMLAKAFLPDAHIIVDASLSRGVSDESHRTALEAMKGCQIEITGEEK